MNIAIFNWRDLAHPRAGGAEVFTHQVAAGLAKRGHRVTMFVSRPKNATPDEQRDGYRIIRQGSESTCRFYAVRWLKANVAQFDVVLDEVNTLPFFSPWIAPRKTVLLMFQLAREVWLAEGPPLLRHMGYALEPVYLRIYRSSPILTISASSARSFAEIGLRGRVDVVEVAIDQRPKLSSAVPVVGRIGFVGRLRPSKRIDHLIRALAIVRKTVGDAELVVVGKGEQRELDRLCRLADRLGIGGGVTFVGEATDAQRDAVMSSLDVISMTSLREGWGLAVSEAARFGVPAVVYPVPGLVDSTEDGVTGVHAAAATPAALAAALVRVVLNRDLRNRLGAAARAAVAHLTIERLVDRFEEFLLGQTLGVAARR